MQASLALPTVSAFPQTTGISLPTVGNLPVNLNALPQVSSGIAPTMNPNFTGLPSVSASLPQVGNPQVNSLPQVGLSLPQVGNPQVNSLPQVGLSLPQVNTGSTPTQSAFPQVNTGSTPTQSAFPQATQNAFPQVNSGFVTNQSAFPGLNPYPQGGFNGFSNITVGNVQQGQGQDFASCQARFHADPTKNPDKNNSKINIGKKTYNDLVKKYGQPPAHVIAAHTPQQPIQQFAPQMQQFAPQMQQFAPQMQQFAPQMQQQQPVQVQSQPDMLPQIMAQMTQMASQIAQLSSQVSALTPPPVVVPQSYVLVICESDKFMIPRHETTTQLIESALALEEAVDDEDNREHINNFMESATSYRIEVPVRRANITDVVTVNRT